MRSSPLFLIVTFMTMGDSFSDFLEPDSLLFSDEWPYFSDITVDYLSDDPIFEETALSFDDAEIANLDTDFDMGMDHFWTLEDNDEHTISPDNCLSPSTTIGSTLRKRQDMCGTVPWVEDDLASEDITTEEVEDYWCSATSKFGVTNIPVCNDDENLKALNPYGTEVWNLEGALFGSMTLFKCRLMTPLNYIICADTRAYCCNFFLPRSPSIFGTGYWCTRAARRLL